MSVAMLLAVGLLGGAGSLARFVLDRAISERAERRATARPAFPFGTLAVNLSGAPARRARRRRRRR